VSQACNRFEREALELLEEGRPLPPHFATCPECKEARESYERLAKLLSTLGTPLETEKWEAGVWERVRDLEAAPSRSAAKPARAFVSEGGLAGTTARARRSDRASRRRWLVAAAAVAVILGAGETGRRYVLTNASTRRSDRTAAPLLALRLEGVARPGSGTRGTAPAGGGGTIFLQPGDELAFDATTGAARHAEVRVYREDRDLQFRCPPGCEREGNRLRGRVTLPSVGRYQAYVVVSDNPLPPPEPTLAADTERLVRTGARIALGPPVQVY
jgi:hypothetical protein